MLLFLRYVSMLAFFLVVILSCGDKTREEKANAPTPAATPAAVSANEAVAPVAVDKSAMDMIYFPVNYPVLKMSGKISGGPVMRVIYSRPLKDGREIFGNIVKYGTYWRLGANESTEIEFFKPVTINGQQVKKGRYVMYCIPHPDRWTIVLNEDIYTWGLKIHPEKDAYSFDVPVTNGDAVYPVFTMEFQEAPQGAVLLMAWDRTSAVLPITI